MPFTDPAVIGDYHAHVYYTDEASRAAAARVREAVGSRFAVTLGRWRDEAVGPHPRPMFQIAFAPAAFATLVPWLMLNHGDLVVFIHPNTGDARADHSTHALWLGDRLALDLSAL